MARTRTGRIALMLCSAAVLAGCGENSDLFKNTTPGDEAAVTSGVDTPGTTKLVERDVEVPEVFQVSDNGLWDGRPSLGGVWVAHPDVTEPERVIIRNNETGKFVIGALFKRERENPGPIFQVSSDAAAALGMLAGSPGALNVTALRREEVPEAGPASLPEEVQVANLETPEGIETTTLDDPVDLADAALSALDTPAPSSAPAPTVTPEMVASAAADTAPTARPLPGTLTNVEPTSAPVNATPPAPVSRPAPAPAPVSSLEKPFIQIGLFSVEDNANRNGIALRNAGIMPTVKEETSSGKTYWRVLAGPVPNGSERDALLAKVKKLGYADAYFVKN
ncbi:SPOR domain-containing protein [Psychromarinibacter sp. S121]|uniref:SPOR domain-containing protein n=1 Tax=Psychromarinibacter sp. S121 TaxID=3415127 RepID=UPI003C7E487C